jgi:predicted MFS family arabinose efflux permease
VGLILLVPVGDIVRRRPLFTGLLAIDTVAVAASAVAPDLELLGAVIAIMGLTSVVIQMMVPYAASLAAEDERAKMIGTVLSGLLTGILLSRTFAGIVAQVAGWRGVYAIAAVVMAATTITLYRALPDLPREIDAGYGAQLRAVLSVARNEPILRWRALIAACGYGAFSAFWTTISFLLTGPQYRSPVPVLSAGDRAVRAVRKRRGAGLRVRRPLDRFPAAAALARDWSCSLSPGLFILADRPRRRTPALA